MMMKSNTTSQPFDDKHMITDALNTQKHLTGDYNTSANECSCTPIMNDFLNILTEEHQIQHELFQEMQKRGWYQTTVAEQTKIDQAKTKYGAQG